MRVQIYPSKKEMGLEAARCAAAVLRTAIARCGQANLILATGASQFEVIEALTVQPDIAWDKVRGFHLDEYLGIPLSHRASFRLYLWQRFVSRLPVPLNRFAWIDGDGDGVLEVCRLSKLISEHDINLAMVGIGENAHLAFNDPPADFETDQPYRIVELDEACRRQQLGEGWFDSLESVPRRAISMSVRQILKSDAIVCTVPDQRKAAAVRAAVDGPVTPDVPASILQTHPNVSLFLDEAAASQLKGAKP